jgi:small membrane protein
VIIQVLLVLAALGALLYFIRRGHNVRIRASKRVAFALFIAVNIYAVLRPEDLTRLAQLLGIGRGTDLIVYLLVVGFVFGLVNTYLRQREISEQLTELARRVAIAEAEAREQDRSPDPTARDCIVDRPDGAEVDTPTVRHPPR